MGHSARLAILIDIAAGKAADSEGNRANSAKVRNRLAFLAHSLMSPLLKGNDSISARKLGKEADRNA